MPGWLARAAWMSISSAARSTTASATRFFRFSQDDEPIFESGGLGLAAADVLLDQVDLGDRHVELGPLGELEEQRLLGVLVRLVDELQAAVAGDPVVDVDDQVALVQVEEAVDRPALVAPAGRRPADVGAGEQLVIADDERPGVDHVEARRGSGRRSGRSRPDWAISVSAKTSPSRSTSAALWQAIRTRSPAAAPSSSALTLVSSPENRSTLSIRRWQVVSSESAGEGRERDRRELDQPREASLSTREQPARVVDPAEVVPALLAEVVRLDQGDPGPLGEDSRRRGRSWSGRRRRAAGRRSASTESHRSSERWVSGSNGRIDSTSSPKNSMRTGSAASGGKTSRMPPRRLNSPATSTTSTRVIPRSTSQAVSSSTGDDVADRGSSATIRASASGVGTGCKQRLERRDDEPGRRRPRQALDHPEPAAEDLVAGARPRAGRRVPGGEDLGDDPGEGRHVVAEVVDVADVGQDDHQRLRRMQPERRRGERAGRAPGAVDRRAAAVLERGEDLRETRRALDQPGQVLELGDGGRRCLGRGCPGHSEIGRVRDTPNETRRGAHARRDRGLWTVLRRILIFILF